LYIDVGSLYIGVGSFNVCYIVITLRYDWSEERGWKV
jgi:hypothetical protein